MKHLTSALIIFTGTIAQIMAQRPDPDQLSTSNGPLTIQPITHGTVAFLWNSHTIYVDPFGGAARFEGLPAPDLILITDIHGDHLNPETLAGLKTASTSFLVPQAVYDQMPEEYKPKATVIGNGESTEKMGMKISAIPMYNLPESADSRHTKGRGNGYIVNFGGKNIYLSGDTADIPEMRALKGIDVAFICMNLPYTMDVNQAASAILAFKPKVVYPYHYRGSDTAEFKRLVDAGNAGVEVRLRDWYQSN